MNILLPDTNVLITGAATGIGKAMALAFADVGANVFVNHFKQTEQAEALLEELLEKGNKAQAYDADVSDKTAVNEMVGKISSYAGGVDVLVNNAGISRPTPFLEISEQDWKQTLDINLGGAFNGCQAVLPGMLNRGKGNIINIVSELGYLGRSEFAAYCASKGALITLTRSLAREFAPQVRVNAIAPGPVMTDLLRGEINSEEELQAEKNIPLQRIAEPEEIAATAVFLASEYASFYCGDVLSPSGGALMR